MQPGKPEKISVLIPTYNEEKNIGRLLETLVHQPETEIMICDGGSRDRTEEICAAYPVKFIRSPKGRGRQLNAGAKLATGEILFFLHADSQVDPNVFDQIRQAVMDGHWWGCCTLHFDDRSLFFRAVAFGSRLRARVFSLCFGDQGIFCHRRFFWEEGGFPAIPLMEDLALSHKLRRKMRARVLPAPIITSARRFKEGGCLRTLLLMQKLKLLYYLGVSPERLADMYQGQRKKAVCNQP